MEVPPDESAADIAAYAVRLSQLRSHAIEIVSKHPEFQTSDFRRTVFVKICAVCDSAGIAYLFLGRCVMKPEWWRSKNGLFTIPPTTPDSAIIGHVESLLALIRCGLTHLIFSQIETTLRAFLRALAPGAANSAMGEFKNVYECLLRTHLKRERKWDYEIDALDFFRTIRNLIHNNGLFVSKVGADREFDYRGTKYVFRHGTNANFLPMPVVFDVVDDMLTFLSDVIEHPMLTGYCGVMDDPVLKRASDGLEQS
jgi:hypothetical protein